MLYVVIGFILFVVGVIAGWKANDVLRAVAKQYRRIKKLERFYTKAMKTNKFQKKYNHQIVR